MNNSNLTIGLYDSGIGGLSLLKKLVKQTRNINYLYLGDNLNAPYGNKSKTELISLTENGVKTLYGYGANIIILACNTLSTTLLLDLKNSESLKNLNVNLYGVFPPKIDSYDTALICTQLTAKSNYVKNYFSKTKIIPLPFLASEIERFVFTKEKINFKADVSAVNENVKTLILGCTHYSIFKNEFTKLIPNLNVVDGLSTTVNEVKKAIDIANKTVNVKRVVTTNHKTLTATKPIVINGNKVFFVGETSFYNKKVFKFILK